VKILQFAQDLLSERTSTHVVDSNIRRLCFNSVSFVVVHVDGVRLCLRTAATNRLIVHPPGNI
jgi:hypothetical protein